MIWMVPISAADSLGGSAENLTVASVSSDPGDGLAGGSVRLIVGLAVLVVVRGSLVVAIAIALLAVLGVPVVRLIGAIGGVRRIGLSLCLSEVTDAVGVLRDDDRDQH